MLNNTKHWLIVSKHNIQFKVTLNCDKVLSKDYLLKGRKESYMQEVEKFVSIIHENLRPNITIQSIDSEDPVVVEHIPDSWSLLGCGNYAAVFTHENFEDYVVKIYAKGRPGLKEEIEVYKAIGNHLAYSGLVYYTEEYLILKRIRGITLYNCFKLGIKIPQKIIKDIDEALEYARKRGLYPHDVHVKNIMMMDNRGVVVDISDFKQKEYCYLWDDFKKAYYKYYLPFLYKYTIPIPESILNFIRKSYKNYKKLKKKIKKVKSLILMKY
jgi:hypothetical protein